MSTPPRAEDFGAWLRKLRRQRDRTQEALADEVGCAVYTLRAIEAGRRRPSREMAERLAAVLGLSEEQRPRFIQLARSGQAPEHGAAGDDVPAEPAPAPLPELLSTKLYAPPPPPFVVPRARLLDRLAAHPARLTLLVAPPGFGKSTLLAQLIAATGAERSAAAAWLSLDVDDDEPTRFLSAVIAALRQQAPGLGTGALNLLRMAPSPQPQAVLAALINDLRGRGVALALVLDDYHTISSPDVHELLTTMVERGPPGLRLLLAARSDPPLPLARWRARGLLAELRAADLRFDKAEASAFLVEGLGLTLSADQVATLEARTEGWAAGLQLAGLSLQGRADPAAFLAAFGGSNRFILDYLVTETLSTLPGHLRAFLLQTAVLRRLCAPLCDAVLGLSAAPGADEAYSRVLLDELERRNLFLIPLDDEGNWWRYHHLFGETLQAQLRAGISMAEVATLHRRAAQWYAGAGHAEEAFHHALAAGDTAFAAEVLERAAPDLVGDHLLTSLLSLLKALPGEALTVRPALAAYAAWALIETGQIAEAASLVAAVAARLPPDASPADRGHLLGSQAHLALLRDQYDESINLARAALALLEMNAAPFCREVLDVLSAACDQIEDVTGALEAATASVTLLRKSGQDTLIPEVQVARLISRQGRTAEAEHRLRAALRTCVGERGEYLPPAALPMRELASILLARGELAEALMWATRALRLAREWHLIYLMLSTTYIRSLINLCGRELIAGRQEVRHLRALARQANSTMYGYICEGLEAELAVYQGDHAFASSWAGQALARINAHKTVPPVLWEYALSCTCVLLALGRADEALTLAERLLELPLSSGNQRALVYLELMVVLARHTLGQSEQARAGLEQAVRRAAAIDAVRPFLAVPAGIGELLERVHALAPPFVERVLTLLAERGRSSASGRLSAAETQSRAGSTLLVAETVASSSAGAMPRPEPLSERELEVLRLLALGRSNQAIADELIIAVGTVKRHLHSIFGKLGVESRGEAIARAHALGLVAPPAH